MTMKSVRRCAWDIFQQLTKTLAEVCLFVNENFSRDDISKRHEHLKQVLVSKLLGQVVDEQIGTFWTCRLKVTPTHHTDVFTFSMFNH